MEHPTTELVAYLQGDLAAGQRERLDAHLAGCGECRRERDAFAAILGALRASAPAPPEMLWSRWRSELADRLAARRSRRPRWLPPVPVAVTAGLAAALLVVVVWLGGESPAPRADLPSMEEVAQPSAVLEPVALLEDLDIIRQLDRLAARGEQ